MNLSPANRRVVFCVLLALATLAAYARVFRNGFVDLDDPAYITENQHIRSGLTWSAVEWASTTYYASNWHPLTWITHAADISRFGLDPAGHHLVNVLLHAANAILLFVLLYRATRREWASLLVAALFALHPVNVESVAWASERKNVLSMLFLLLTMIFYTSYARRPSLPRYLPVMLAFALGLLAKPQIVTLPFLLLLWDFWPLGRWAGASRAAPGGSRDFPPWPALIAEKVPLFLLSAASAALTLRAQSAGGALQISDATHHAVAAFSAGVRLANAVAAYGQYLFDALWPLHLAAMYPHPGQSIPLGAVILAAAILMLLTVLALAAGRRYGFLATGWFWFLGAMVPMIGLVQVGSQSRADRYAYLPFIGLYLIAAWAVAEAGEKQPRARTPCRLIEGVALLALGILTFRQVQYWRNPETLWNRALETTQGNFFAHDSLAAYLMQSGRLPEACSHFESSLRIFPGDIPAQEGLGVCYQARGQQKQAILQYENVLRLSIDATVRATAFANLGSIYRQLGNYAQAKQNYESALELNPDLPIALVGTGLLAQKGWDFEKAAKQYARAMSVEPTSVGYLLLARALEQCGRPTEAQSAYAEARRLAGDLRADQKTADGLLAN